MMRTLVRKGLSLEKYCRSHDPNRRGLMRKKAFVTMLKAVGLPFSVRELQEITLHYVVPGSDQADYVTLLKDLHIVHLDELNTNLFENTRQMLDLDGSALKEIPEGENGAETSPKGAGAEGRGDGTGDDADAAGEGGANATKDRARGAVSNNVLDDIGVHTQVLADARRMLLDSIRSLNKDADEVYRMFARWDINGSGTVTATQFLRVLARLHVNLSDQDQDFLVELLDTSVMGRIDFEGLLSFCFSPGSPTGAEGPEILSPVAMSGGGSLSMGDWADGGGNETMSAVSTENNSVDLKSMNSNALSSGVGHQRGRPRTATLSRPYNEQNVYNTSAAHTTGTAGARGSGRNAVNTHSLSYGASAPTHTPQHSDYYQPQERSDDYYRNVANKGAPGRMQRPMTASARVSTQAPTTPNTSNGQGHGPSGRYSDDSLGRYGKAQSMVMERHGEQGRDNLRSNPKTAPAPANTTASIQPTLPRVGPHAPLSSHPSAPPQLPHGGPQKQLSFQRNVDAEDSQYVAELPDDVMYGEEKYLGADSARNKLHKGSQPSKYGPSAAAQKSHRVDLSTQDYYGDMRDPPMHSPDLHDMGSFNDNTLLTEQQDEYFYGSPKELPQLARQSSANNGMGGAQPSGGMGGDGAQANTVTWAPENAGHGRWMRDDENAPGRGYSRDVPASQQQAQHSQAQQMQASGRNASSSWRDSREASGPVASTGQYAPSQSAPNAGQAQGQQQLYAPHPQHGFAGDTDRTRPSVNTAQAYTHPTPVQPSSPPSKEPIEHLVLLANQILSTLRDIITTRYRRGNSLQEIFQHFDRDDKNYFDARDFIVATSDLRIETSPRVASIAINMIALDGYDKVSFGEFKVFVLDSDHKLLELNVQEQLAQILEQKGREYQSFMIDMFWNEEESLTDSRTPTNRAHRQQNEFVSKSAFVSSLQRIGLILTSSEINRLVDRFDVYGNEMCSVVRFVRMVHNSRAWRHGERVLAYQDEAIEEAEYLRQQLHAAAEGRSDSASALHLPDLPEELISMCEYLGIRVLSEPNMVWIAADALKAPLPVSWTAQRDANGRTYFYNHLTGQSKLEHPLDPHFRKLRDKYRQGG
jgi:Ca2+-binding EF-hand superfamily protein